MTSRPLEYHNSLIWIAAFIIFVDSVSFYSRSVSCDCFPSEMVKVKT